MLNPKFSITNFRRRAASNEHQATKNAQILLETCLAFVAIILLLLGITRIWLWFNQDMAERQPAYNETRLAAGSSSPGIWPVHSRRSLTEDWVLRGENFPSESNIDSTAGGGRGTDRDTGCGCEEVASDTESEARDKVYDAAMLDSQAWDLEYRAGELEGEAAGLEAQADADDAQADHFQQLYNQQCGNRNWGWFGGWNCQNYLRQINEYRDKAQEKRDQAQQKRNQAQQKRNQAQQKREQADGLREEADGLFDTVTDTRNDCWNSCLET